jgi:hypothetical protein
MNVGLKSKHNHERLNITMTLSKKELRNWAESARILFTPEQKQAILERFGSEPEPYVWSEQDIAVQIRNYLGCGEFVKPVKVHDTPSPLTDDEVF